MLYSVANKAPTYSPITGRMLHHLDDFQLINLINFIIVTVPKYS